MQLQLFVKGLEGKTIVCQIHKLSLHKKYVSPIYVRKRFTLKSYHEIFYCTLP